MYTLVAMLSTVLYSLFCSVRFDISIFELKKFVSKSINLSLCYIGFLDRKSIKGLWLVGKAGFFCSLYDVITDWKNYNDELYLKYKNILGKLDSRLSEITIHLYQTEKNKQTLKEDGLERGVIALEFVTRMIGSYDYTRKNADFYELGIVMQIVDDVLDFEEDRENGDMNCLLTNNKNIYLGRLIRFNTEKFANTFKHAYILKKVIYRAQEKAEKMLSV